MMFKRLRAILWEIDFWIGTRFLRPIQSDNVRKVWKAIPTRLHHAMFGFLLSISLTRIRSKTLALLRGHAEHKENIMCACYRIDGPFIGADPDCPLHGRSPVKAEPVLTEEQVAALSRALQVLCTSTDPDATAALTSLRIAFRAQGDVPAAVLTCISRQLEVGQW